MIKKFAHKTNSTPPDRIAYVFYFIKKYVKNGLFPVKKIAVTWLSGNIFIPLQKFSTATFPFLLGAEKNLTLHLVSDEKCEVILSLWGCKMNEKTFKPASFVNGMFVVLVSFFFLLGFLWVTQYALTSLSLSLYFSEAAIIYMLAVFVNNAFFSKFPYKGFAPYESVGFTGGIATFFCPITLEGFVFMLFGFAVASHLGEQLRIRRLKKIGYSEAS